MLFSKLFAKQYSINLLPVVRHMTSFCLKALLKQKNEKNDNFLTIFISLPKNKANLKLKVVVFPNNDLCGYLIVYKAKPR